MTTQLKNPQIGLLRRLISFLDAIWAIIRLVIGGIAALFGKAA